MDAPNGGVGDVQFLRSEQRGYMYAVARCAIIAGEDLLTGLGSLQASAKACAESCDGLTSWCDVQGACTADISGSLAPQGACQLITASVLEDGQAVLQLTSGCASMGTAGVKVATPNLPPTHGYTAFPAHSLLLPQRSFKCSETERPGMCALPMSLQGAWALCTSWPDCSAFAFLPGSLGNSTDPPGLPLAIFVGRRASASGGMDVSRSNLPVVSSVYVKQCQLLEPAASWELSSGAIVGVAAGAAFGYILAAVLTMLLWLQHCRYHRVYVGGTGRGRADEETVWDGAQGGQGRAGEGDTEGLGPSLRRHAQGNCSSHLVLLVAAEKQSELTPVCAPPLDAPKQNGVELELFNNTPRPKWEDVILPGGAVVLCRDAWGNLIRLGKGASGQVFRAHVSGLACACKVFELDSEGSRALFLKEASLLWRISCPSVVHFIGVSVAGNQGLLCMELMESDLYSKLRAELPDGTRLFSWYNRGARIALQIAGALSYLHSTTKLAHGDIKPGNVLLSKYGNAKLADVGFSNFISREVGLRVVDDQMFSTFDFCSPEVLLGKQVDERADIWSFGVLLNELCSGRAPRRGTLQPLTAPEDCCEAVAALQQRCMSQDPQQRPDAAEVVAILQANQPGAIEHAKATAGRELDIPAGATASQGPLGAVILSVTLPFCTPQSPLLAKLEGLPPYPAECILPPLEVLAAQRRQIAPQAALPLAAQLPSGPTGAPGVQGDGRQACSGCSSGVMETVQFQQCHKPHSSLDHSEEITKANTLP